MFISDIEELLKIIDQRDQKIEYRKELRSLHHTKTFNLYHYRLQLKMALRCFWGDWESILPHNSMQDRTLCLRLRFYNLTRVPIAGMGQDDSENAREDPSFHLLLRGRQQWASMPKLTRLNILFSSPLRTSLHSALTISASSSPIPPSPFKPIVIRFLNHCCSD
mgnify:CR=1 FL=1